MNLYKYTVNGHVVTRTWADGTVERFDLDQLPNEALYHFAALGVKEREGTGGVMAGKTDWGFSKLKALSAQTWRDALEGIVTQRGGSTSMPTPEQLTEAFHILAPEANDAAIAKRVVEHHPDHAKTDKEKNRRRRELKKYLEGADNFRDALVQVGFDVPEKPSLYDMLKGLDE